MYVNQPLAEEQEKLFWSDAKNNAKERLVVSFVGPLSTGKSSAVGHLIEQTGVLNTCFQKIQNFADSIGKSSHRYAFVCDSTKNEQERGLTVTAVRRQFLSNKYNLTLIATPGHRYYQKNMIRAAFLADVCALVVTVDLIEFKKNYNQTKFYIAMMRAMGAKQIIVLVNKMDLCDYQEQNFLEIVRRLMKYLRATSWSPENIQFLPISALEGINLLFKAEKMPWYHGPTLSEAFDNLKAPIRMIDKPLRIPVTQLFRIGGVGTVVSGKIESGTLKKGMTLVCVSQRHNRLPPYNLVQSIESHHIKKDSATAGDIVGIHLRGVPLRDLAIGDVLGDPTDSPPFLTANFIAEVIILKPAPDRIRVGYGPVMSYHTSKVACSWKKLYSRKRKNSNDELMNPEFLERGDRAVVEIEAERAVCVDTFENFPSLGRIFMRDHHDVVAVGIIKQVDTSSGRLTKGISQPRV